MTTFVLVHGAFRGGWAWGPLRRLLVAAGHDVHTPSLTGMGDRRHLAGPDGAGVDLATWVSDIATLVESHDLTDVVLVGHSQGGLVTTAAGPRLGSRVARQVYLDAPVPADGERGVDLNPPGVPVPDAAEVDLDAWLPARPVEADDELSPELAEWVNARLGPTPLRPSFDRVALDTAAESVARTYVFFDRTPPTYPCWFTRGRLDAAGQPYRVLDAGHDAPLTHPEQVAALLLEVAG